MPTLHALPRGDQREEPWANGAGTTTVILRDPDTADWMVRVSVAKVESGGPFSELPGTRRILVPLDARMTLRFPDGHESSAARFGQLEFAGAPAVTGLLPEGPTRDFNLMLRGRARGDVFPRTLVDSMLVPHVAGGRWLVYLDSGGATLLAAGAPGIDLHAGDAALVTGGRDPADHANIEGTGEIILVRLYA